jgi:hypothetical protein
MVKAFHKTWSRTFQCQKQPVCLQFVGLESNYNLMLCRVRHDKAALINGIIQTFEGRMIETLDIVSIFKDCLTDALKHDFGLVYLLQRRTDPKSIYTATAAI